MSWGLTYRQWWLSLKPPWLSKTKRPPHAQADIQTDVADRILFVISTSKTEFMRYELNDYEWRVIKGVYS
jgi:hypothetical protein